jgi:hypothetical protein
MKPDAAATAAPEFAQRHYSVLELAEAWNLGAKTVRALFEHEPGVLVIDPSNGRKFSKRRYRTLRIPEPVAARVHARLSKSA